MAREVKVGKYMSLSILGYNHIKTYNGRWIFLAVIQEFSSSMAYWAMFQKIYLLRLEICRGKKDITMHYTLSNYKNKSDKLIRYSVKFLT